MKLSGGTTNKKTIKSENITITQMSSYTAHKTISQEYSPNDDLKELMETFTKMVNHCLKIGIKEDCYQHEKVVLSVLSRTRRVWYIIHLQNQHHLTSCRNTIKQETINEKRDKNKKSSCKPQFSYKLLWGKTERIFVDYPFQG